MRDLKDFEIPIDGEIALCEIDGRMHTMNVNYCNLNAFTLSIEKHPKILITRDSLHPVLSGEEGKALFLPVDVPFLKQLSQVYYEQGFIEALRTAAAHDNILIKKTALGVLNFLKLSKKIRLIFNPNILYSGPNLINELGQTKNWHNSIIRCISWHPYLLKIAVGVSDDSVRIFSAEDQSLIVTLRYKQQRNVSCIAWRPLSNTEIAVGHENGIIVWNVDFNSLVARPSISNATILYRLDHRPILSIAWSPKGDLLVSAAACDKSIIVWDVELNKTSYLRRPGGSGNLLIKWSPTGEKLFSSTNGVVFRVWDCHNWESEKWTVLSGRVQSACWTKCGSHLLFATNNEPTIYGLIVKTELIFSCDTESSSNQAVPLLDVSKVDLEGVLVGGLVQTMETDPSGNHLAVIYQETNCITVFNVVKQPVLKLVPSSLVMGFTDEKPSTITFQQNFSEGACLTIGWSSGRIQYYPIIYSDLKLN